ncbi:antirestriction protein ArdA [Paraburkholderia bryophila]|uniref:antirestriction protein ArdA n=1 Tax=Paraburkholderia bryophila TaxID=420952 RepID=UPI002349A268|nr:antirestriction protein ArdA [Paraburkholderia bryophila]WCM23138.1 antirestriction protein ArdA [Paraburkholderia bryophila]
MGYSISDALDIVGDVMLFVGDLEDAASEIFDDLHAPTIPAMLLPYFDLAAYARDLELGGDLAAFRFNDTDYVVTNASGL